VRAYAKALPMAPSGPCRMDPGQVCQSCQSVPVRYLGAVMLHPADVRDLEAFFGPAQAVLGKSTMGGQLDRARVAHSGSDGEPIVPRRYDTVVHQRPDGSMFECITAWPSMLVKREAPTPAGGPEEHDEALQVFAVVGRRLEQLPLVVRQHLELLYGDHGTRWHQQPQGRVWALTPVTIAGERQLKKTERPGETLLPTERLAMLAAGKPRPAWVETMLDQAEWLERAAERWWLGTKAPTGTNAA
jgi:hypothetical protein